MIYWINTLELVLTILVTKTIDEIINESTLAQMSPGSTLIHKENVRLVLDVLLK